MANKETLENIKKLRELTGVGFKDCKLAIDENGGDLEKSVDFLRKKGIAKASKKMSRTASEGLVLVHEENNSVSLIEINSETDFVAKNKDFISFCKEIFSISASLPSFLVASLATLASVALCPPRFAAPSLDQEERKSLHLDSS